MSRRSAVNAVLTVAGIALLVWQVDKIDPVNGLRGGLAQIGEGLRRVGAGFALILGLALVRFVLRSHAWRTLLGRPAPFSAAIAATISGDALGNITPLGLVASEPAKAAYLGRHVDATQAFAALTAENFFYIISVAVYIIIGAVALLFEFDDLPELVRLGGIGACVLMALVFVVVTWIAWQRPAIASSVLTRIPSERLAAVIDRVRDFEVRTYGSAGHESARLGVVAATETAFHVVSFAESWLTLYLLTGASLPLDALILDSVNRVINAVFKLIPMRVGVDEVTTEAVALAIGLAPGVGVLAALVRKVRMIVLAAVGLAIWTMRDSGTTGTTGSR